MAFANTQTFAPMTGYSGTPLPQKLGIKEGTIVVAIDAPENYRKLLDPVPSGVNFASRPVGNTKFVHLFATRRSELAKQLSILRRKIAEDAAIFRRKIDNCFANSLRRVAKR